MTEYQIGQDVIVESDALYDGEAFMSTIDEETETLMGDGSVYIDVRDRTDLGAEIALVSKDSVVTLTDVFDTIRQS